MRIRVVSSREEISRLNPNEHVVHLIFRPSNKDIFELVETCPKLEVIQLPRTYIATVSKSMEMFLKMQRIQLIEGDVLGHRKCISEYYAIPSSVTEKIRDMKIEGKSNKDIEVKVSRENRLNPKIVTYIINKEALA